MKKILSFVLMAFLSVGLAFAQNITVSGTVLDETGLPMIGRPVFYRGSGVFSVCSLGSSTPSVLSLMKMIFSV